MDPVVLALFRELADRSPSAREEYYTQQGIPAALRAEVESLLRFDGETADDVHARVAGASVHVLRSNPRYA
jgi:hypothetical protein